MKTIDFKNLLGSAYNAKFDQFEFIEVPKLNYLMIDGFGDPNISEQFKHSLEALYGLDYTIKFMLKNNTKGINYKVMPLEGLWWANNMEDFILENKNNYKWTMMIM